MMLTKQKGEREQRLTSILTSHAEVDQALAKVCFLTMALGRLNVPFCEDCHTDFGVTPREAFKGTCVLAASIEEHLKGAKRELAQLIDTEKREAKERLLPTIAP